MNELIKLAEEKMKKSVAALERELSNIRAGRATPAILDRVTVDYYGVPTPIGQMAAVSVVEARALQIQPWDTSTLSAIEKAINQSDIGINPQNNGKTIMLNFPPLTEERRKELVKDVHRIGEESKVAVRSIRRDLIDKIKAMKKNSEITEDAQKKGENDAQKLTDKYIKLVDDTLGNKEKEIMEF